ncbi:MAG: hypothetical protein JXB15_06165 [Anaerolineales bacterium]|nr:hypothetical protein [Anaerolineales bacterium]
MPAQLDLNLIPLARSAGTDYPELLGLHVAEPPRKLARGRSQDRLVLYLAIAGNAPLAPGKQEQLLADLAKLYYDTPGSVTSALRAVGEELNRLLLERNLRLTSSSRQGVGLLAMLVLRDQQAYLSHSGPLHSFLVTSDETREFYQPDLEGMALGQSRSTPLSFFQLVIKPNDTLILAAQPSAGWNTAALSGIQGQGPESLRRRLTGRADLDLNAVVVQFKPGTGKHYIHSVQNAAAVPVSEAKLAQPAQVALPLADEPEMLSAETLSPPEQPLTDVRPVGGHPAAAAGEVSALPPHRRPAGAPRRAGSPLQPLWKFLVTVGTPILMALRRSGQFLRTLLGRLLPEEAFAAVPSTVMAFVALAVPVIIVTIASAAYFQLGRAAQYEIYYNQARKMAAQAAGQTDLIARRSAWDTTVQIIQQAEKYDITPETQALRQQAQQELDALDLVQRVDYLPAVVGGLPQGINVIRMAISVDDLYLLDGSSGSVLRLRTTSRGYEVDPTFQCGPSGTQVSLIGPIVDILPWPAGFDPPASLLAADASGNLLFCLPGVNPTYDRLLSSEGSNWGKLVGITQDAGDLYALDSLTNAVWIYWGGKIVPNPSPFFLPATQIPALQDVIDLVVNGNELYLLRSDGRVTLCNYTANEQVKYPCSDPPFIDFRPGRENLPMALAAPFVQVLASSPPDPSLFLLEPKSQAIFHFSFRNLAFQRQYLPLKTVAEGPVTAFLVHASERMIFLAIGNQVFYGALP